MSKVPYHRNKPGLARAATARYYRTPQGLMQARDRARRKRARDGGYVMPPHERDCPPRPQDGRCQSCRKPTGIDTLCMDHDHQTGMFRGWVCTECNKALGLLGDTIAGLEMALSYLRGAYERVRG